MERSQPEHVKKKLPGGYWFLLLICLVYLLTFLAIPARSIEAFQFSMNLLAKLVPIMAVVFFLMFLSNLLLKPEWVKAHVGHDSGVKGYLIAVGGGIFSVGPIYVWFEFLRGLKDKGMRTGLIATFLYARSVKPHLLPLMVLYFGWTYTLVLEFYLILFALLHGWMLELFMASSSRAGKL